MYSPTEVFSIAGVVEGSSGLTGGFAIAETAEAVIQGFRELGFHVVSVSSMADIATSISALEGLKDSDPDFSEADYLNLLAPSVAREESRVFTFTGSPDPSVDQVYGGFAVAPDRRYLADYLAGLGFRAHSIVNLAELRSVYEDLQRLAAGDDDESVVSFKP
jgi:hypothetical protein